MTASLTPSDLRREADAIDRRLGPISGADADRYARLFRFLAGALERLDSELTFDKLRAANRRRIPQFRSRHGILVHASDGADWSLNDWCTALTGEVGEAANLLKKLHRGDYAFDEVQTDLGKELADIAIYLDILAFRAGIDLGDAIIKKFNEVSVRVKSDVFLP